jgi:hypothetical protein
MHEVKFIDFVKSIATGLIEAVKTDIDVFLMAFAAVIWPIKIFRGLFTSTLIYVIIRRVDGLMSAFINIKKLEIDKNNG